MPELRSRGFSTQADLHPALDAGYRQSPPFFGVLVVAGLVVIAAGLADAADIVAPTFLVLNVVITVSPLRRFLVQHGWPATFASVVSMLVIYLSLIIIFGSVVWSILRLVDTLPDYASAFDKLFRSLQSAANQLGVGEEEIRQLSDSFQLSSLRQPAESLINGLASFSAILALIIALAVFMSFEQAGIEDRLDVVRQTRSFVADGLEDFATRVRKYWVVTTLFGVIVALLDVVALLIIGVPLAFTWGVLAFVTNYIPNVGFIIGVIPPLLIALLHGGAGSAIAVLIAYSVINVVVQTLVQPRFTGDAVGISPTAAFLSLVFWAYLLGGLGALVAIPATLFAKSTLLDHPPPPGWFSALISSGRPGQPQRRRPLGRSSQRTRSDATPGGA